MKLFSIVTSVLVVSLVGCLVACGGGGSRKSLGKQCPADPSWAPFPMKVADNQEQISLNPSANKIPPGVYTYEGATIYYVDKSDFRVQAVDVKQKDNSFKAGTGCIRNAGNNFNPMSTEGIRDLRVSNDKKYLAEVTNFAIGTEDTKFKVTAVKDPNKKLEAPADAYKTAVESYMVSTKGDTTNYEIRSSGVTPNGTYQMQIRLTRKDN
jgi:hypothetical protein